MKKTIHIIAILLFLNYTYSQELIKNNGFEEGTIPTHSQEYIYNFPENVPYWRQGCDTDNVLGNLLTPDILTLDATNCIWKVPNNDHTLNLPVRTAGTTRYVYCGYSQSLNLKESIIGELNQPLTAGTYNVSFYGSKVQGKGYCGGSNTTYPSNNPGATIEVILRKSNDLCNSSSSVMWTSSQISTLGSWQQSKGSFVIDCAAAAKNYDRIEFRIKTQSGVNGIFLDDVSLKKVDINPNISVSKFYCSNIPLAFSGTIPSGESSLAHMWEIQESNYNGTILIGSPLHTQWISGSPSSYTFPSNLNLPCNKYYRVKLATSNNISCEWVETSKVIILNCAPTLTSIPNQTICNGDNASFTISTNNWPVQVYNGASFIGTFYSNPVTLSPTTTTTYSFKVTNGLKFGCSTTQNSTVTVKNCPRACFDIKNIYNEQTESSVYGPQLVKILCLPQIEIDGSCSTNEQGYHIRIAEFSLNPWQFLTDYYDGWVGSGLAPNSISLTSLISIPSANNGWNSRTFDPTKLYAVALNVGPVWNSAPLQFFRVQNCRVQSKQNLEKENKGSTINVYPNPTNDYVNFTFDNSETGVIEIFSFDGKNIYTENFKEKININFNFSKYENGIYLVKITIGNEIIIKKIIKK